MLGVGAGRQRRIAVRAAGLTATALMVVVGCAHVTAGAPAVDRGDAARYRTSAAEASSQAAAVASERESTRRESETAEAVANGCEMLSSASVEVVTAINAYVSAVGAGNEAEVVAKGQAAVDSLNRNADVVASTLTTALLPQMAEEFRVWVDATRAVAKAIAERYGQREFNAEVDKFNLANDNALNTCGGSH